jgi:Peptidase S24-like
VIRETDVNAAAVRRTLDNLIRARGEDYASVSRLLGRNQTYIQQFIRRGVPRKLDEDDRRALARHFDVPEHVLGGPPARVGRAVVSHASETVAADDYLLIPYFNVGASAGAGAILAGEERAESALAFQSRWIRRMSSGDPQALSVIRVEGDSMLPTLADGDPILVDTADAAERLRDGIYVLRVDDTLMVKRLTRNPATRGIAVRSDNPAYPSWDDCRPADVDVIGRVIWVGRELR